MKNLIRKLKLKKDDSELIKELNQYVVIYKDRCGYSCYDVISEYSLKEMLLNPKDEIRFIFKFEDRIKIETKFEELEEGNSND